MPISRKFAVAMVLLGIAIINQPHLGIAQWISSQSLTALYALAVVLIACGLALLVFDNAGHRAKQVLAMPFLIYIIFGVWGAFVIAAKIPWAAIILYGLLWDVVVTSLRRENGGDHHH